MPDRLEFDLIVIGAGPAGENAAVTAALLGQRVAVVEKLPVVGGAAVNTGTLPSKTLRETAVALSGLRSRALYGVDLSLRRDITVEDLLHHERAVKKTQRHQIRGLFEQYGVQVFHGTGSFHDPHTVRVTPSPSDGGETLLRGAKVVVAIGSAPIRPPGFDFSSDRIHDSDELVDLRALPKSLAVIGAGVIGSEYACMFAALGVRTILIDGRDRLLPFLDADVASALEEAMKNLGVEFIWGERVSACTEPAEGAIQLALASGRRMEVDQVLVCAGRASRTAELHPEAAGLTVTDKGRLAVNEHYQTNVPHVYAVGDVIGFPALASTSAEQGRVAACHAFDAEYLTKVAPVLPTGIYTIPEVSAAGETEASLQEKGVRYLVGRADYSQVPRGKIIGERLGFLKLLFRQDDLKLVGVQVLGEQATEVVHIGVVALMMNAGVELFLQTCFNYPTLGELYKLATHNALLKRTQPAP